MGLGSSFQMPGMLSAEWLSLAAGGGLAAHKALILANAHSSILSAEHLKLHEQHTANTAQAHYNERDFILEYISYLSGQKLLCLLQISII